MSVITSEKKNFRGNLHHKDENLLMTVKRSLQLNPEEIVSLEMVPAIVIDVVRNESHEKFSEQLLLSKHSTPKDFNDKLHEDTDIDYSWIGRAQIRLLTNEEGTDKSVLDWAFPLENGIKEYPLKNEVVIVTKHLNTYFYTRKLNIKNLLNHDASYDLEYSHGNGGLSDNPNPGVAEKSTFLSEIPEVDSDPNKSTTINTGFLGDYFKENHKLRPLEHFEGDSIIEGRNGNSIRMGAFVNDPSVDSGRPDGSYPDKTGNPMILIRNRQKPNIEETVFAQPILEDVNLDGTSIHITSGTTESVYKTTVQKKMYGSEEQSDFAGDAPPLPKLDGNQVVINSDRLVFSSRLNETFCFSKQRYSIITDDIFTLDADKKIAITTNSSYHLKAHDRIDVKTHQTTTWESVKDIKHFTQETTTWNSKKNILFQTPEEYTLNANKKFVINSPEIFLGKGEETDEPVLMGSTTLVWIANLVYELIWRMTYKVDKPGPKPALTEEYIHYKYMDKIMEDLMRQAPNCISRKVFVSGHDTATGIGKMKRKPKSSPFNNIKRKGNGSGSKKDDSSVGNSQPLAQQPVEPGAEGDLPKTGELPPKETPFSPSNNPSNSTNDALLSSAKGMVGESTANLAGNGSLSCAASVNEMAKRATGQPITNSASTTDMFNALKSGKGTMVPIDKAPPGAIIISPTEGSNHGHVGIIGENGKVYSNSSSAKEVKQNFTTQSWNNYYSGKKSLPTYAFVLNAPNKTS